MIDPRSTRFLDLRHKRLRFWWWLHLSARGRYARKHSLSHRRPYGDHIRHLRIMKRIRECPHTNRRPNPDATAVLEFNPQICLDCGTGITTHPARRPTETA